MKVLELFCGTKSFTKVAEARGHECRTLDIMDKFNPTYRMDILRFQPFMLNGWHPDIIWASPPCECFSVNTIGKNWMRNEDDYFPKTSKAAESIAMIAHTIEIIQTINPTFYIIENPRAMLRKIGVMDPLPRKTVTYCQYGEERMKPTDLWTNVPFEAKSCKYGDSCHKKTPRGCYSGKSYQELAKVPPKLCEEILITCESTSGLMKPGEE